MSFDTLFPGGRCGKPLLFCLIVSGEGDGDRERVEDVQYKHRVNADIQSRVLRRDSTRMAATKRMDVRDSVRSGYGGNGGNV